MKIQGYCNMMFSKYKYSFLLIWVFLLTTTYGQNIHSQSNDPLVRQYYSHFKHPVKASALTLFASGAGYFYAGNIKRGLLIGTIASGCGIIALRESIVNITFLTKDAGDEKLANTMVLTVIGLKFFEAFDAARIAGKYNAELAELIFGKPIEIRHNYILIIDGKEVH